MAATQELMLCADWHSCQQWVVLWMPMAWAKEEKKKAGDRGQYVMELSRHVCPGERRTGGDRLKEKDVYSLLTVACWS